MDNKVKIFLSGIGILVIGLIATVFVRSNATPPGPGIYDTFAQCLKEKGVTFYGAYWCPNCTNQKKLFGKSAKLLPYVECSTADGKGQLQVCKDKNIAKYPTWEFLDGTRLEGVLPLTQLAEKTACALPSGKEASVTPSASPGASSPAQ